MAGLSVPPGQRASAAALQRFARSDPLYRFLAAARSVGREADLVLQSADSARRSAQSAQAAGAITRFETAARLMRGDAAGAAGSAARVAYSSEPWYVTPLLRLEGQAREQLGDTAGAVRAYRRYLVLRFDPDPELRAYNDSVRAALTRLERR